MKKEHRIIMLPSEKPSQILFDTVGQELVYNPPVPQKMTVNVKPQHLYILSDEKFKEGDKLYSNGDIFEATKEMVDKIMPDGYVLGMYPKKIIATTDAELHYNKIVEEDMHMYKESLPHIPQHIIEAYVKKPFDKVMVEYYDECKVIDKDGVEMPNAFSGIPRDYDKAKKLCNNLNKNGEFSPYQVVQTPKLNQDGTLAVSLIKEKMYSNESRKQLIRDFHQIVDDTWDEEDVEKWIKENL
jgi:uncharacterized protein YktA (UPF0223 family)